ncbi:MAG: hypothetical protein JNJ57_12115 [Saprospiraceae bacterium]|nr:hypothetical protein [Saprospiraceae bacterium]
MKKFSLLLALLVQVITFMTAQTNQKIIFANLTNVEESYGNFLQNTSDGGYILTGHSSKPNSGSYSIPRLIKLNAALQVEWDKNYLEPSPPDGVTAIAYAPAQQTADGGYALAVRNDSTTTEFLKLDATGNVLWEKDLVPYSNYVSLVGILPDESFVVTIKSSPYELFHLDPDGNILTRTTLVNSAFNGYVFTVLLSDNHLLTAYKTANNKTVFLKTTTNGTLIWQSTPQIEPQWWSNQGGSSLSALENGEFAFLCYYSSINAKRILRYDASGNLIWQSADNAIPATLISTDLKITPDGQFLLSGNTVTNRAFVAKMNPAADGIEWSAESPEDGQEHLTGLWAIPTADGWAAGVGSTLNGKFGFMKVGVNSGITINTLTGRVAKDNDQNCAVGNNESGIPYARVRASNGSEIFNDFTDGNGNYTLLLPAGQFEIEVFPNQPFFNLCPNAPTEVNFPTGNNSSAALNLPMQSPELIHEINGTVRLDQNNNCTAETDEPLLTNWQVKLHTDSGDLFLKTDVNGEYKTFVPEGYYEVELIPLNNHFSVCSPNPKQITFLGSIPQTATLDFVANPAFLCARMRADLGSNNIRPCSTATIYASYRNDGTVIATDATLQVTLDPLLTYVSSTVTPVSVNGPVILFDLGNVPATPGGTWKSIQIEAAVDCSLNIGDQVCASAAVTPDEDCSSDPNWSGAIISVSGECTDEDEAVFVLKNIGNAPSQVLDYIIIEDQIVLLQEMFQLEPAEELRDTVPGNALPLSLIADQEPGYPGDTSVVWNIFNCGGNSNSNSGFGGPAGPYTHQECFAISNSFDPNDKSASPEGNGPQHFVHPGTPLEYRIRFQNTGNDTAFLVVIRDTLSQHFNFGKIEPRTASHRYEYAQINDSILQFTFENILLPDSTTNPAGSQGFADFTIYPKDGLPDGTEVVNRAAIYFDFNEPIITNEVSRVYGKYVTVKIRESVLDVSVNVFPNPFMDQVTFEIPEQVVTGNESLQLFDAAGRLLRTQRFEGAHCRLLRETLPAGAAAWNISQGGRVIAGGVVVAQ